MNIVVERMDFVVEGREDLSLNLLGDLSALPALALKDGALFRLRLTFRVQNEIVSGLRYHHTVWRKGIREDQQDYMIGTYPPQSEPFEYLMPVDELPKGFMARATYKVKSKVMDDVGNTYLAWEWRMAIQADWP